MNIVTSVVEWQTIRMQLNSKTVGFVPTMGHLHSGHLSLCERSRAENDVTVMSIFVNPTQFNQESDFTKYPRTIEQDQEKIQGVVDYLFLPNAQEIYHDNYQFKVTETEISKELEGEFRPGHFDGMLTIVLKLFNLTNANRAYFGEKDFQQLLLVKKMVQAFFLRTEVIACETIRAEDGLALSSRNSRLTAEQRAKAKSFPALLNSELSVEKISQELNQLGFKVDYVVDKWQRRLAAIWLDDVRLIDNIPI